MSTNDAIIDVNEIMERLRERFPEAKCELDHFTPYELLIAVILSAQCTDKRVNMVTPKLFAFCNDPFKMSTLTVDELIPYIRSCGFYNNKAKAIIECSKTLVEHFNGEVPADRDALQSLAGVGRKTANVVYAEAFNGNAIAVDTHVFRVANRLGLVNAKTPEETEKQLNAVIPECNWREMHHLLIFLGRYGCKAINPQCSECNLQTICKYHNTNK